MPKPGRCYGRPTNQKDIDRAMVTLERIRRGCEKHGHTVVKGECYKCGTLILRCKRKRVKGRNNLHTHGCPV